MELAEAAQSGLRRLADPGCFSARAYAALLQAAFRSLLSGQAHHQAALDHPDLEHIDPAVLKFCHAAAATCIVEAGKHRAERAVISTYLEDCKFDRERIEQFCTEYQKNKDSLEILLGRYVTEVDTNQLHKNYHPAYLMTLNVEGSDSRSHPDLNFSCSMEQLQDLVGKLKDAAKSLERTTQL
uniref:COMM domain-containing protein 3 n=1 Tax=Sphaerodactylus townsendi TaxID=933632 RepID=A0ACB8FV13_9SAUR